MGKNPNGKSQLTMLSLVKMVLKKTVWAILRIKLYRVLPTELKGTDLTADRCGSPSVTAWFRNLGPREMTLFQNYLYRYELAGRRHDQETETLIGDLLVMGVREGYLSGAEDNPKARLIGKKLSSASGGNKILMLGAYFRVRAKLGHTLAAHLEACWNNIGDWQW